MASTRVQIPFSFSYPSTDLFASQSAESYAEGTSFIATEPVVGASVSVSIRDPNNPGSILGPAVVYQAEGGTTTLSTIQTDTGGNTPGWVNPGSYRIDVASVGTFAGASINWEAVRGDGVTNLAAGSVNVTSLATAVAQALVPTGTIFDYAGATAPAGYHFCDGSVQSETSTTFSNLFSVIGGTYNTGGEGTGNFRLPNTIGRFTLGAGNGVAGYSALNSRGGSLGHTHSVNAVGVTGTVSGTVSGTVTGTVSGSASGYIVQASMPLYAATAAHYHGLNTSGFACMNPNVSSEFLSIYYAYQGASWATNFDAWVLGNSAAGGAYGSVQGYGVQLGGGTSSVSVGINGDAVGGQVVYLSGGSISGTLNGGTLHSGTLDGGTLNGGSAAAHSTLGADPAFITFNKIIKL